MPSSWPGNLASWANVVPRSSGSSRGVWLRTWVHPGWQTRMHQAFIPDPESHQAASPGTQKRYPMLGCSRVLPAENQRHRAAAEWMSDWADRPDVDGWMLKNLVQAFRTTGNDHEASRASRFAVALPCNPATAFHELWLILDDLLAGPYEGALTASPASTGRASQTPTTSSYWNWHRAWLRFASLPRQPAVMRLHRPLGQSLRSAGVSDSASSTRSCDVVIIGRSP